MVEATRPNPCDLWMPLFGIETDRARAAQLRRMLRAVPWELADQLYGSRKAMQERVAQMTTELEALQRRIEEEGERTGETALCALQDINTTRRAQSDGVCLHRHTEPSMIFTLVNRSSRRCGAGGNDDRDGSLLD